MKELVKVNHLLILDRSDVRTETDSGVPENSSKTVIECKIERG